MSTTPANPNIKAMRESVQKSYVELQWLIDGSLASLEKSKLYKIPVTFILFGSLSKEEMSL